MAEVGGLVKFHFSVNADIKTSQRLFVCGSIWQLGAYDFSKGIELFTSPDTFPIWKTKIPILLTDNVPISYKYVARRLLNDHSIAYVPEIAEGKTRQATPVFPETTVLDVYGDLPEENIVHPPSNLDILDTLTENTEFLQSFSNDEFLKDHEKTTVFLVSFHLPVIIRWVEIGSEEESGYWEVEWEPDNIISQTDGSIANDVDVLWIGGISKLHNYKRSFYDLSDLEREEIKKIVEAKLPCKVVLISKLLYEKYYIIMCKQYIRNNFHGIVQYSDYRDYCSTEEFYQSPGTNWEALKVVMNKFSNAIMKEITIKKLEKDKDNFIVWVHDYHLSLLPKIFKEKWRLNFGSTNSINSKNEGTLKTIFFSHIPFPTPAIFQVFPWHISILQGFLSADVIGFHLTTDAQYFLDCVKRFLGYTYRHESGKMVVELHNRKVHVVVYQVSIEKNRIDKVLSSETTKKLSQQVATVNGLRKTVSLNGFRGMTKLQYQKLKQQKKTVFLGIYEMQCLKGSIASLKGFETFLDKFPDVRKRVLFFHHGIVRKVNKLSYFGEDDTMEKIKTIVLRINKKYGPVVKHIEHSITGDTLQLPQRIALYQNADIMVCLPHSEGLNLLPAEFNYVRSKEETPGVLIVSISAEYSDSLYGALSVNCHDIEMVGDVYYEAMQKTLKFNESDEEFNIDTRHVDLNAAQWTRCLINEASLLPGEMLTAEFEFEIPNVHQLEGLDLGVIDNFNCNYMDFENIYQFKQKYANGKRRLIFLDYGGTLAKADGQDQFLQKQLFGSRYKPLADNVKDVLKKLCKDPKNIVFISSSFESDLLYSFVEELLKDETIPLGLIANCGVSIRWGNLLKKERLAKNLVSYENKDSRGFKVIPEGVDLRHLKDVKKMIKSTCHFCPGSLLLQASSYLKWDYKASDPEWAETLATGLVKSIKNYLETSDLSCNFSVSKLNGCVQVYSVAFSKGTAIEHVLFELKELEMLEEIEIGIAIGDGMDDEEMFVKLFGSFEEMSLESQKNRKFFTISVGRKHTCAMYYVNNVDETISLLNNL